MNICRLVFEF